MTLGERIAVMHEGRLQQCAPPLEVYRRPVNAFVAGFVGSPAMNFLDCELRREGDTLRIESALLHLSTDRPPALDGGAERRRAQLGIRPQDMEVVAVEQADLVARVDVIEPLGSEVLAHLELGERDSDGGGRGGGGDSDGGDGAGAGSLGRDFCLVTPPEVELAEGATIGLRLRRDRLHLFESDTGARLN